MWDSGSDTDVKSVPDGVPFDLVVAREIPLVIFGRRGDLDGQRGGREGKEGAECQLHFEG